MDIVKDVVEILSESIELTERADSLNENTLLFGEMPEFDSFTFVVLVTALEERFGFQVDADDLDESVFESIGSLVAFVESKVSVVEEV